MKCLTPNYSIITAFMDIVSSDGDNTVVIVGGVLGTDTLLAVMVVVVILMRNHGCLHFTGLKNKYVIYNNYIVLYNNSRGLHM